MPRSQESPRTLPRTLENIEAAQDASQAKARQAQKDWQANEVDERDKERLRSAEEAPAQQADAPETVSEAEDEQPPE